MGLREKILSEQNIFNAIHALKSYVFEDTLLSSNDLILFNKLQDEFNCKRVELIVSSCQKTLEKLLDTEDYLLSARVYFKLKKYDKETDKVSFRPVHTAGLREQICMTALLQALMFEDDEHRDLSDVSKQFPHYFYGNRPSVSVDSIFEEWQSTYRQYTKEIVSKSHSYADSHDCLTEVTLDIRDFFPSIPPKVIIEMCCTILGGRYNGEDAKTLRKAVEKLVFLKIDPDLIKPWEFEYYGKTLAPGTLRLSKGVAQGLPQSYFFGNLCMAKIRQLLNKEDYFRGDPVYYVDDSAIYIKSDMNQDSFKSKLKNLNADLAKWCQSISHSNQEAAESKFHAFHDNLEYNIQFHEDIKSSFCHIDQTISNLYDLPKTASGIGSELILDEIDQNIAFEKMKALELYTDNFLHFLNGNPERIQNSAGEPHDLSKIESPLNKEKVNADKKILRRYRKLFLYNAKRYEFQLKGEISDEDAKALMEEFSLPEIADGSEQEKTDFKEKWFEAHDGSRFGAVSRMLIRTLDIERAQRIMEAANDIEVLISGREGDVPAQKSLFYKKDFKGTFENKSIFEDSYESLRLYMAAHYRDKAGSPVEKKMEALRVVCREIDEICGGSRDVSRLLSGIVPDYMKFALRNSPEMKRRVVNAFFSYIWEFEVSDQVTPSKRFGRPITYLELRILAILRNKNFNYSWFKTFIETIDFKALENKMHIDCSLINVLPLLLRHVSDPQWIDNIIQTHRIAKGLWQNGSKFLNSYTLHNEDHAVTVIRKAVDLVGKIQYLSLKKADFYLVFLAAYLHDISMVIHPDLKSINKSREVLTDAMRKVQSFFTEMEKAKGDPSYSNDIYKEAAKFLRTVFQDVYDYFETSVRESHASESARFITGRREIFTFLAPTDLSVVARVGEAHGLDVSDVFGLRSWAAEDAVSEKYMMMILRLADLQDVANDRINYHLLRQNVAHMSQAARFHWVSHLITDSIRMIPEYRVKAFPYQNNGKTIFRQHIEEILNFELLLNVKCLAP